MTHAVCLIVRLWLISWLFAPARTAICRHCTAGHFRQFGLGKMAFTLLNGPFLSMVTLLRRTWCHKQTIETTFHLTCKSKPGQSLKSLKWYKPWVTQSKPFSSVTPTGDLAARDYFFPCIAKWTCRKLRTVHNGAWGLAHLGSTALQLCIYALKSWLLNLVSTWTKPFRFVASNWNVTGVKDLSGFC